MELYRYSPTILSWRRQGKIIFFYLSCYTLLISSIIGSVVKIYTVENYAHKGINKSGRDSSVSLVTSYRKEEGGFILFTGSDFSRR
jgi:hypothetical protein